MCVQLSTYTREERAWRRKILGSERLESLVLEAFSSERRAVRGEQREESSERTAVRGER